MTIHFDLATALSGGYNLTEVFEGLSKALEYAKAKGESENNVNQLWREREIFGLWKMYSELYTLLKESRYYEAWCLAERIQIDSSFLLKNFPKDITSIEFLLKHLSQLQMIYPYRLFISSVLQIKEERCSICDSIFSPWHNCGHIPGRIYYGKLCCKIVHDASLLGADFVRNPENKYSVVFMRDANGNEIDNYDYSVVTKLMQYWNNPFQNWRIERKEIYVTPPSNLNDNDICPCQTSFQTYSECCKNRPGILSYHYTIYCQ